MSNIAQVNTYIKDIPLYQQLYGEKIKNFDLRASLEEYPPLERFHIINGFPSNWLTCEFQAAITNNKTETTTTSGTSGHRIQIIREKNWWAKEYIRTYKHSSYLSSFVVDVNRRAILTTALCSNAVCYLDYPAYEDRIIANKLYLNMHQDPNTWSRHDISKMVEEIDRFKPTYLDADPIYLTLFLKKLEDMQIKPPTHQPNIISLSYEIVTGYARRFIQGIFHCPIINMYGTTEVGYIYIEENGQIKRCHELSQVHFIPYWPNKGIYRLLVTSWKNNFMPFIRLNVGDLVKINTDVQPNELVDSTIIEGVFGREKDVIFTDNGIPITTGEIDSTLSELNNAILIYQINVNKIDMLFRYISKQDIAISECDKQQITEKLNHLFGNNLTVRFRLEKSISPEISGKFTILKKNNKE